MNDQELDALARFDDLHLQLLRTTNQLEELMCVIDMDDGSNVDFPAIALKDARVTMIASRLLISTTRDLLGVSRDE